ncbi:MAG TPA: FAD/NAD(P)-binding oxidoreductase [Gammaproteobacteria bacterium]|nr:FAD/NAD(P)-binding oxidoreductase [Gammaproteobacteria bacterium]
MTDRDRSPDVAVIGAGPAGLAAATELRRQGVRTVTVLDRESEPGGIPRHCGHPAFGVREFHRVLSGPAYARRLAARAAAAGVTFRPRHTVVALNAGGELDVTSDEGPERLTPRRVILATGTRETPRAARLVGGDRPLGVLNTGALQAMVYLKGLIPFRRPLIVGTELVSFSALLTCRHAGIRPVKMIEEGPRPVARRPSELLPRALGVPLAFGTRLTAIYGATRVEAVETIDERGDRGTLECDGVLMTGGFLPEAALVRGAPLAFDPKSGGPEVDQYGRCSDPAYFAAGNVLRPVETAGWSYREGVGVGRCVADDLAGRLPAPSHDVAVTCEAPIKLVVPQRLCAPFTGGLGFLQLRVGVPVRGELSVSAERHAIYRRRVSTRPERRLLIPLRDLQDRAIDDTNTAGPTLHCRVSGQAWSTKQ